MLRGKKKSMEGLRNHFEEQKITTMTTTTTAKVPLRLPMRCSQCQEHFADVFPPGGAPIRVAKDIIRAAVPEISVETAVKRGEELHVACGPIFFFFFFFFFFFSIRNFF
jgi:peptide methionine sulfoxide reductase MsrB